VENVEVTEKVLDMQVSKPPSGTQPPNQERPGTAKLQAKAELLRAAVANAMADIGETFSESPEVASALSDWKARLDSHVQELQDIVQHKQPPSQDSVPSLPLASQLSDVENDPDEKAAEIMGDVANVRCMRQQLESHRTGRDVEEVVDAWSDPAEMAKEVEELRRARRQIRYLFGGMIGNLPDSSNLRIDDLISEHGEAEPAYSVPMAQPTRPPGIPQSPRLARNTSPIVAAVAGMPEASRLKAANAMPVGGENLKPSPRAGQVRPRSGGTESLSSVAESSVASTWNSQNTHRDNEEERTRRKERKQHRSRGREHRSTEPGREASQKKDDGAMPSRQWNWAEEVVKASLDPGNQWEFPGTNDGRPTELPPRAPRGGQPSWEQPRQAAPRVQGQRGNDIALKARERADEVTRTERDRHRNFAEPSNMVEVSSYR
jgi:hypothetical protein